MDPARYVGLPGWRGVMFRRKKKDHRIGGGLWDIFRSIYGAGEFVAPTSTPGIGIKLSTKFNESRHSASWGGLNGARVDFEYPEPGGSNYEEQYQGLQAAWLGFDEWTHFDWPFVSYVFGRMRSPLALPRHLRGSCNPDPDSWLLDWVEWYLDDAGYPRREASGVVRWWARHKDSDEIIHGATRSEVRRRAKTTDARVWSFAFFPATAEDNAYMLERNPAYAEEYMATIASTRVREERLGRGNWYAREEVGGMLAQHRWDICRPDDVPTLVARLRCWDRAATLPSDASPDPDYSASILCGWDENGRFYAGLDDQGCTAIRDVPGKVATHMRLTAMDDGPTVTQRIPIDPGAVGKDSVEWTRERMAGPLIGPLDFWPQNGSKEIRAQPLSEALEQGRCSFVRGPWADRTYHDPKVKLPMWRLVWGQMDPFPNGKTGTHKDFPDCAAGAFAARQHRPYRGVGAEGWANVTRLTGPR